MRAIAPSMLPHACPRQERRRPKPIFFAFGANGTIMRQWLSARREAKASDSSSSKVHRREGQLATVPMKPDIFTLLRCASALSFFSCCDSVAALALANCNWHVAEASISRPHPPTFKALCTVPKLERLELQNHLAI
jgi:hypothetical protein